MTPEDRERAMRSWDKTLRSLAHLVIDVEDLEAAPMPTDDAERWDREKANTTLRMDISRALDALRDIEKEFPECRYWEDYKEMPT